MARGATSRSRDQYEPVEDGKSRRCSCFYGFLIFLTVLVLLAVAGGAGFAGWLIYTLRPESDAVTYVYDVDLNGTESVYPDQGGMSGGDIQYSRIVPYDPSKDAKMHTDETTASPTIAASPVTLAVTTLGTASRVLAHSTDNKQNVLQPAKPPVKVSDAELLDMTQSLWNAAQPKMLKQGSAYQITIGRQVNESVRADLSPHKLFTVKADLYRQSLTYTTFLRLLDNYNYVTKVPENYNEADIREINQFLDALVTSPTIQRLQEFLVEKGLASSDTAAFRLQLWEMWFRLYNRSPKYDISDSSGFEHVFVGEIRKNKVIGLHSWIQLYQQEKQGHVNYHGYYSNTQPRIMSIRLKWHEKTLRNTSFFVGTPPEYDMAVYTLCALVRNAGLCPVSVAGERVSVYTGEVKHIDGIQIADAYLAI